MSNQFTTQQIQDQFASLPADMQTVISSANTADLIQSIGSKHNMRIDAVGILIEYSGLMMLGLIDSDEFVNTIARAANVPREKAANIVLDIDTQVFSQVRNSLQKAQYKSTNETRFEQASDFAKPAPTTPSVSDILPDTSIEPTEIEQPINSDIPMAGKDYDPNSFGATTPQTASPQNDPVVEDLQPVSTTGPSALAQAADQLDSAFEVVPNQSNQSVEIQLNTSGSANKLEPGFSSAETDREVGQSIAASVTKNMPQAVKDAYKTGQAAAPAPAVSDELVKDFQTKLEEKLAGADTSVVNNDPYKESI